MSWVRRASLLAGAVWYSAAFALGPEVQLTYLCPQHGALAALAFDDSARAVGRLVLAGTATEGAYQFYILKIDTTGQPVWTRLYGSTDHAECLCRRADGSLLVLGYTTESTTLDYRLMRVTAAGGLDGSYRFGGNTTADDPKAFIEWPQNTLFVTGRIQPGVQGSGDAPLVRVTTTGDIEWGRSFVTAQSASGMALAPDSTLFIYGTSDSTDTLRSRDLVVIRCNVNGDSLGLRRIGGSKDEQCSDAWRVSSDLTIVVGAARATSGPQRDFDVLVQAVNDQGDSLWSRTYGTIGQDVALSVAPVIAPDSGFVIAGYSENTTTSRRYAMLMKISPAGDSLWTLLPDSLQGELADVQQDSLYRYHAAGHWHAPTDYGLYLMTEPDPAAPGPHRPQHFSLVAPTDNDTLVSDTVSFSWTAALDPDSGDTVRYTVLIDADTTFAHADTLGPLDSVRCVWMADTDEVRLFWRVVARDLQGLERICRQRQWSFRCSVPDSTQTFNLVYPDSALALPRSYTTFRWERAVDNDPLDTVRYVMHFMTADTELTLSGLRDSFVTISFTNNPFIHPGDSVGWFVVAHSQIPPMSVESRQHWWFHTWTAGSETPAPAVLEFALDDAYPNPFNSTTVLRYSLDRMESVKLEIYNVEGRHVVTLAQGVHTAGVYSATWDGTADAVAVPSGVYFARLQAESRQRMTKLVLLR